MAKNEEKTASIPTRILIVDADEIILDNLTNLLETDGYEISTASSVAQAIDCLKATLYNIVITEVSMPAGDGFELLKYIKMHHDEIVVIMTAGYGTIESAVEAIKQGAYEYLTKPLIDDDVRLAVRRALKQQQLLEENRQLKRALRDRYSIDNIIGNDFRMAKIFELINAVADSNSNVLISGESGTGKSLVARAIHAHSSRREKPFVEVSCGALPDTLLESELFGHVKGAFTDAVAEKIGKFAAADGGTIFLDEISSASPQLQVKLLRVLQERQFEQLGSNETQEVDVRIIFATNTDLQRQVKANEFREDLFYRINVLNIEIPSLRERIADVPLLAEHFLEKYIDGTSKRIKGFSTEALELMKLYQWPGNVRELENCVERGVVLCDSSVIKADDLPPVVVNHSQAKTLQLSSSIGEKVTLSEAMEEPEKQVISAALEANDFNRKATAEQLDINRTTLYKKMKKYDLFADGS